MFSFSKKIILTSLIIFLGMAVFLPSNKTQAFWGFGDVSTDPANLVENANTSIQTTSTAVATKSVSLKEITLDGIAFAVAKEMLSQMIQETTDWVNSGFDGNPAYIEDPERSLKNTADNVIGDYIWKSEELNFLCSPFSADIKIALQQDFTRRDDLGCTLSDVVDNVETAIDDLGNEWDWDTWSAITQNPNNNAYGAYMEASFALNSEIELEKDNWERETNWGKGFRPVKECVDEEVYDEETDSYSWVETCNNITMGDSIAGVVNKDLGRGGDTLVEADEIDELIGAVLGQLVNKALREGYKNLSEDSDEDGRGDAFVEEGESSAEKTLAKRINKAIMDEGQFQTQANKLIDKIDAVKDLMEYYAESWDCSVTDHDEWFKRKVVVLGKDIDKYEEEIEKSEENVIRLRGMLEELGGNNTSGCSVGVEQELGVFSGENTDGRLVYSFSQPGGDYCGGGECVVSIDCGGNVERVSVPSSGERYENGDFTWAPFAGTEGLLTIIIPSNNLEERTAADILKDLGSRFQSMSKSINGESEIKALNNKERTYRQYITDANTKYVYCVAGASTGITSELQDIINEVTQAIVGAVGSMFSNVEDDSDDYTDDEYNEYNDGYDACDEIDTSNMRILSGPDIRNIPISAELEVSFPGGGVVNHTVTYSGEAWPEYDQSHSEILDYPVGSTGVAQGICWYDDVERETICGTWDWNIINTHLGSQIASKSYLLRAGKYYGIYLVGDYITHSDQLNRTKIKWVQWPQDYNNPLATCNFNENIFCGSLIQAGDLERQSQCFNGPPPPRGPDEEIITYNSDCVVYVEGERGNYVGDQNGGRPTYEFSQPGDRYCGGVGCFASVSCSNVSRVYNIPISGQTYQEGDFIWDPYIGPNNSLVISLPFNYGIDVDDGLNYGDDLGFDYYTLSTSGDPEIYMCPTSPKYDSCTGMTRRIDNVKNTQVFSGGVANPGAKLITCQKAGGGDVSFLIEDGTRYQNSYCEGDTSF